MLVFGGRIWNACHYMSLFSRLSNTSLAFRCYKSTPMRSFSKESTDLILHNVSPNGPQHTESCISSQRRRPTGLVPSVCLSIFPRDPTTRHPIWLRWTERREMAGTHCADIQSCHSPFVPLFWQVEANGAEGAFSRLNLQAQYAHSLVCHPCPTLDELFHPQPHFTLESSNTFVSLVCLYDWPAVTVRVVITWYYLRINRVPRTVHFCPS